MAKKKEMDAVATMPQEEKLYGQPKYKVESAVRTLQEAHEIRKDPGLHEAAKKHAHSQATVMKKVAADGGDISGLPSNDDDGDESDANGLKSLQELKRIARKKSSISG